MKTKTACPHCQHELTRSEVSKLWNGNRTKAQREASRRSGRKGGRPKKRIDAPVPTV